eukprot:7892732-Pyramimonas_sp.AAC.1
MAQYAPQTARHSPRGPQEGPKPPEWAKVSKPAAATTASLGLRGQCEEGQSRTWWPAWASSSTSVHCGC